MAYNYTKIGLSDVQSAVTERFIEILKKLKGCQQMREVVRNALGYNFITPPSCENHRS